MATKAYVDDNKSCQTVRNCVLANVANLAAFTVAGNDGITNVEGDIVLLVAQSIASQNGPYTVGAVAGGTAALTRVSWWAAAATMTVGVPVLKVRMGTLFKGVDWEAMYASASTFTVGTHDPGLLPRSWHTTAAFPGTGAVSINPAYMGSITSAEIEALESSCGAPHYTTRSGQTLTITAVNSGWSGQTLGVTIRNWKA